MPAVKTQGTDLYTIDPTTGDLLDVGCITSISGIDETIDQVETTCLNSDAREYIAGLATPGAASFGLNIDPQNPAHIRLYELKQAGINLQWAIGWSDGTAEPTTDTAGFVPPTSRSWLLFEGFMNSFPFEFALNSVVASTVGIQVSGGQTLIPKST